jgi:hypothetical protein
MCVHTSNSEENHKVLSIYAQRPGKSPDKLLQDSGNMQAAPAHPS